MPSCSGGWRAPTRLRQSEIRLAPGDFPPGTTGSQVRPWFHLAPVWSFNVNWIFGLGRTNAKPWNRAEELTRRPEKGLVRAAGFYMPRESALRSLADLLS